MSNDVKALSISFRSDDGCIEHNNRDFFTDNVDKSRTPNNITYVKRDLRELYHELFAVKLLDEYMRDFEQSNSNLKVFNAVMHLDEATPHLHKNFVPVCYGQKQGLSTRVLIRMIFCAKLLQSRIKKYRS